MKVGDLVKITRASLGVPKYSIALIVSAHRNHKNPEVQCWNLLLANGKKRRTLERDLEILSLAECFTQPNPFL